jgi:hypothetical protein
MLHTSENCNSIVEKAYKVKTNSIYLHETSPYSG